MLVIPRNQTATYWSATGTDTFGKRIFAAPDVIKVRWEDRITLVANNQGQELVANVEVWLQADYTAKNGDYIALGNHSTVSDPLTVDGAREIRLVSSLPLLGGSTGELKVFL